MQQPFPLIKLQQTDKNQNAEYGLNSAVQMAIANSNVQFAIQMARQLKISYSIPTIALQIAARFFHLRCYVNYDRFMIILGCIILAFKLKYMEFRLNDIVFNFYKIMSFRCQVNEPIDEQKFEKIKDQICIAQSQVLRTLQYEIDVTTPHDYLNRIFQHSFPGDPSKNSKDNKILLTTRVLILDSNRVLCSLYFSPLTVCVASLMIVSRYEGVKPYSFLQNKSTDSSYREKTDQQLYSDWIEMLGRTQNEKLRQEDILECIRQMNKIFTFIVK